MTEDLPTPNIEYSYVPPDSLPSDNSEDQSSVTFPMNYDHMPSTTFRIEQASSSDPDTIQGASDVFESLCLACRSGDIETTDSLLSTPDLNINQVDEWDYSPLILASLCGHTKIVELLLIRGAVCDRDTFQGARCLYGALNDTIRDLLISFDISKKVDMSQPFASHISSLLSPLNQIPTSDIVFWFPQVNGLLINDYLVFRLNRFILAARSPYFFNKFKKTGAWYLKSVIEMPVSTNPVVFKVVVDYAYLRTDTLPIDKEETRDQLIKFASKLQLNDLLESIDIIKEAKNEKEKAKAKHEASFMFVERARKDLDAFLINHIVDNSVTSYLNLQDAIDFEDISTETYITEDQKQRLLESPTIPDIILSTIDSESESVVYFPVHKAILARSEYFETMFKSDIFLSSQEALPVYRDDKRTLGKSVINRPLVLPQHLPVIQISSTTSSSEVSKIILSFLYHDDIPRIPMMHTIELLFAADELFLERLKTMCAVNITSQFSKFTYDDLQTLEESVGYSPYDLIRISRQTRCDKLEQHITKLLAYNLKKIYHDAENKSQLCILIEESAYQIKDRQDTDTIELIDEIRYYLGKKYAVNDEFTDFEPIAEQFREYDPTYTASEDINIYKNAIFKYDRDIDLVDSILDELQLGA